MTLPITLRRRTPLTSKDSLEAVLHRARTVGFLGPGPIRFHVEHAMAFAAALPSDARTIVDIGSGGGIPGLPIALARPDLSGVLLDASQKRTAFLVWAVSELGLVDRLDVVTGRAEDVARDPAYRATADAVVSRGFGPPAMTVECAAGLVRDDGLVVISEPPTRRRWPVDGLAKVGLVEVTNDDLDRLNVATSTLDGEPDHGPDSTHDNTLDNKVVVFRRVGELPDDYPRSAKQLKRDPIFELG